ncbi:hypothetical protein [Bacillus sp. REN3]|uniref:hypothetical protein n=1 Tax=Bacillus sp. REN3 TaxID=2802440 RepID=UPI001AEDD81C|nr:hypothetical protein [Bacillus sp. REN3]
MNPKVKSKINRIATEANAIARELEGIAQGIGHEFKGIGSVKCASGLRNSAEKYRYVSNQMRRI